MSRAKRTSQQESSQQPVRSGPPVGPPGDVSRRSFLATGASMAGAALVGGALPATAAAAETDVPGTARHPRPGGLRPSTTTLEYAERPLPTDVRAPRFGWAFPEGTSGSQSGYRIRVATSADRLRAGRPDVWDSGEVRSSATGDIAYAGDDLAPRTGYCWQVRTRDAQGRDGGWSRIGEFETALVDEGWGDARWIGRAEPDVPDVDLAAASWIWEQGSTADGGVLGTRYLRGSVDLPAGLQVSAASLVMTADDDFTGWLQGSQVLEQPQQKDAWRTARQVDVTDVVTAAVGSTLVLAARVTNRGGATVNPGALLAVLTVTTASGDELTLVTDESWRLAESPGSGWEQPDFDDSDWDSAAVMAPYGQGPWGSGVSLAVPTAPAPLLRREFTVERDVVRARLYLSAGGYAVATINGRRVTDDVLEPGFTDYDDTVLYVVHDVTSRIRRGRNVIGAELGRGFFGMTTSNAWNWNQAPWHGEPRMLARLVMTHRDGSTTDVVSDQRWTMSDGPTTVDNLYAGESHDTRLVPRGWDTTAGDVDGWVAATPVDAPRGRLVAQQHEPIRVVDTVAPVSLTSPAAGVWVADFGRTAAGWTRLRMSLPAGTTVRLTHGETLAHDGTVEASNGNAPGRCQVDEFTAAEGDRVQEWEPRFTYHGFRYVQLDGLPGRPPAGSVHLRVVHS
ncbi:MAG: family 78 glycoside hydrolase catalytic domain, partial [Williamsia herbipolensis]|nr:family 78 glycoside hydrolase catalytic domain [Williamsia herbipolensis]